MYHFSIPVKSEEGKAVYYIPYYYLTLLTHRSEVRKVRQSVYKKLPYLPHLPPPPHKAEARGEKLTRDAQLYRIKALQNAQLIDIKQKGTGKNPDIWQLPKLPF